MLSILEAWGNNIKNTQFQKILFLFCKEQEIPTYYFFPYKYGCFSLQSYADKNTLTKYGYLDNNVNWIKNSNDNFINTLTDNDRNILLNLKETYINYSNDKLIEYVYDQHPYYAIKSDIYNKYMSRKKVDRLKKDISQKKDTTLFTLGYEGITIDKYLDILISNNIKSVCDVRKNPISMKYGFSKKQLEKALMMSNINYYHLPSLGIESNKRKGLKTYNDYENIFQDYKTNTLPNNIDGLNIVLQLLKTHNRIALTCFEKDHNYCHRNQLVLYLQNNSLLNTICEHL